MIPLAVTASFAILPLLVLFALGVGFVFLLIKAPKAAAVLIGVVVVLFVGLFYVRSGKFVPTPTAIVSTPDPLAVATLPWQVQQAREASRAPIWSPGMDGEFEADVYPSRSAALKAAGRRIASEIQRLWADPNGRFAVILFQGDNDSGVVAELEQAMEQKSPGLRCSTEANARDINPGEAGVTLRIDKKVQMVHAELDDTGGAVVAFATRGDGGITITVPFVGKPWVEDFGRFASERPQEQYVVARSNGTCMSENEARTQAMNDASRLLNGQIGRIPRAPGQPPIVVTSQDIQQGGFVTDTFVQSFTGSAGKIWRQAILLDVSAPKLAWLTNRTIRTAQVQRLNWARQIGSGVGVLVLILVTYLFLNMATRGYYEWSLRIAGIVLAIIAIVVFLG
jgi:hypothetical protein